MLDLLFLLFQIVGAAIACSIVFSLLVALYLVVGCFVVDTYDDWKQARMDNKLLKNLEKWRNEL